MTRTSIVNIETGQQKLLVHNLFRIADALSLRPTDLIAPLEPDSDALLTISLSDHVSPGVDQWVRRGVSKATKRKTS